jgi:cell division GTPase FtsZ
VDTDLRSLKACGEGLSEKLPILCLGEKHFRGFGSGGDVERIRKIAEENDLYFQTLFENRRFVVFLTALGGGVGNGLIARMAGAARRGGALVLVVATLPFEFEGHERSSEALRCVRNIQTIADGVVTLPNDLLFQVLPPEATVQEAFAQSNEWVCTLLNYVLTPTLSSSADGEIFARLLSIRPEILFFAWGVGKDTFAEAVEDLFRSPFWKTIESPSSIRHLSVSTFSDKNISLSELRDLHERLKGRFKNLGSNCTTTQHTSPVHDRCPSVFVFATGHRHSFDIYRHGRGDTEPNRGSTQTPNNQIHFQFSEFSDNDDYLDIPTYLRKGLRIDF